GEVVELAAERVPWGGAAPAAGARLAPATLDGGRVAFEERAEPGAQLVEGDRAGEADVGAALEQLDPARDGVRVDRDDGDVGAPGLGAERVEERDRGVAREVGGQEDGVGGKASHALPRVI